MRDFEIVNTSLGDWGAIMELFQKAMNLQGENGYKVWAAIDEDGLKRDIVEGLQYKIQRSGVLLCIFSIQFSDPFIWQQRDKGDAIYLHRIVVNPEFKGQRQFQQVLNWATAFCIQNDLKYVRMDTWADNAKIIAYYKTFGFEFIENRRTGSQPELPIQNRDIEVALLEMDVHKARH